MIALLFLIGGFGLGLLHFGSLTRVTDCYAEGAVGKAIALQALRFLILVPALVIAARFGALALLAAALGLVAGRLLLTRREGRVA